MIEIDNQESLDEVLSKNEKVLALFYASWCGFCTRFVPVFEKMTTKVSAGKIVHVLLDDYDSSLWDDYSIDAVPTVLFFDKGKVSKRLDGKSGVGLNEKQLRVWLQEFTLR